MTAETVDEYDEEDMTISDSDFGFIIDADGNLKSFFIPEEITIEDVPESVFEIMEMFGYDEEGVQDILNEADAAIDTDSVDSDEPTNTKGYLH